MNLLGLYTLFYKEVLRFTKVLLQTLFAPLVTALLYLAVFAQALAGRVEAFPGVSYTAFLVPGLIMMSVTQNAFANSSSSLIQSKLTGNLVFLLLTPLSHLEFFLGFLGAAIARGLLVGIGIYVVVIPFMGLPVHSVAAIIGFGLLGAAVLGVLGIVAGIWAEKFDQLAGFQNFVIVPLSFLSGVFYSIHSLPPLWVMVSHLNPFFYMIDGFRFGFFGVSDVSPWLSLAVMSAFLLALSVLTLVMLRNGYRMRN